MTIISKFSITSLLALPLLVAGCDASSVRQSVDLSKLTYQKDGRTGECYAVLGHAKASLSNVSDGFTITWVPCSEGVLRAVTADGNMSR